MNYPKTKKGATIDTYFGTAVKDPYRWLEDDRSEATKHWVEEQNEVTTSYLERIPFRNQLKKRLTALWNYEKVGTPFVKGKYTYFYKNDGLQNQHVLYRILNENDTPDVFLDPNTFSTDGTTALGQVSFSKDGSLVAYTISKGGSDWRTIIVMDTVTKTILQDTIVNVKFSGISWKNNEGFFYSSYDKPEGSELSAMTDQHKVYYHTLGTSQNKDLLIFGEHLEEQHRYVFADVTEDGRYLIVSAMETTSGNKLFIKDLHIANSSFITIVNHTDSDTKVVENKESTLYLITNLNAPNKKIVTVDASHPTPEHWKDIIPETASVLNINTGGGYFFAQYMVDAVSKVIQYDLNGSQIRKVILPGIGSISGFGTKRENTNLYYSFTNYNTPETIYRYDIETGISTLYHSPSIDFDSEAYISTQCFYTSKDGTKIPMMITHKKGILHNGKNPTILYGYGGFNISLTPSFSIANSIWLEQGGILAVPNLRGGGEYGKQWHDAGTKMQKQNVFDDFIAAATYLIHHQYTSSEYLAIKGGSNGGLLVGATMTQRPDLMQVALPAVGVLDMLRYHTFTAGAGWAYDYGTSEDSEAMFTYLKTYSPIHAIKKGTSYPSTLITTGDHDDRVVPAHSFKFAATLQEKHTGNHATLIRVDINAGHGAGKSTTQVINEQADIFAFTLYEMGYTELPKQF